MSNTPIQDTVFGELVPDEMGFRITRSFPHFANFYPSDPSELATEDLGDDEFRAALGSEIGVDLDGLLDKPLDEIDPEILPENVKSSPLGFLIKHGERLQSALESMLGEGALDEDGESADEAADEAAVEAQRLAAEGILPVFIDTLHNDAPTDPQRAAFEYFQDNEPSVCSNIMNALLRYYQYLRNEDPNWFDDWECPEVDNVGDLSGLVSIQSMAVLPFEHAGMACIGFQFDCDWDIEHGLGVLVHKDAVVDIGASEAGIEPQPFSAWQQIEPGIVELATTLAEAAEVAHAEAFEALPPSEQLTHALVQSDDGEIEKLLSSGADIDGASYPAIFVAIDECNPDLVKRILDLGASTTIRFENQNPLEHAREYLQSINQSKQLFADLGADLMNDLNMGEASPLGEIETRGEAMKAILDLLEQAG